MNKKGRGIYIERETWGREKQYGEFKEQKTIEEFQREHKVLGNK